MSEFHNLIRHKIKMHSEPSITGIRTKKQMKSSDQDVCKQTKSAVQLICNKKKIGMNKLTVYTLLYNQCMISTPIDEIIMSQSFRDMFIQCITCGYRSIHTPDDCVRFHSYLTYVFAYHIRLQNNSEYGSWTKPFFDISNLIDVLIDESLQQSLLMFVTFAELNNRRETAVQLDCDTLYLVRYFLLQLI